MVLAEYSDASYLSKTNAQSQTRGHFSMSNNHPYPPNNGALLAIAQIIKAVVSSSTDAEIGALYINSREAISTRQSLKKMGHP